MLVWYHALHVPLCTHALHRNIFVDAPTSPAIFRVEPPATCAPCTSKKPSVVRDARRTSRITDSPVDMHIIYMHMVRKKSPARRTIEHSRSSVSPVLPRLGAGAFSLIRALEPSHKHPAVPTTAQDAGREWTAGLLSDRAASASRLPDIRFEVSTRFGLARTLS